MEMQDQLNLVPDAENQVQDSSPVQETVSMESTQSVAVVEEEKGNESFENQNEVVIENKEEIILESIPELEIIENNENQPIEITEQANEIEETVLAISPETDIIDNEEPTIEESKHSEDVEEIENTVKNTLESEVLNSVVSETEEKTTDIVEEHILHEEEDEHEVVDYHHLNESELIIELTKLVSIDNILGVKNKISEVKIAFNQLIKDTKKEAYNKYIEEGGDSEKYHEEPLKVEEEFNSIFKIFKDKKAKLLADQEADKAVNLEKKLSILEKLRELINSESTLRETYNEVKELQEKWREIGHVPQEEHDNLWKNYHFLLEKFHDKVKINNELRDLDLRKNLEAKIALAEKAEELIFEKSINKSFKLLQEYHAKWKDIGSVPQDKSDEIWERFKTISDKINERRREHYDSLIDEQKQNYVLKSALCEKAEEIASVNYDNSKDWQDKTEIMNNLLEEWKTLGPAPKKLNDEIWARFKQNLNTFFQNKKEVGMKYRDEQTHNYNLKLDICRQAEAIKDSTDWKKSTNELIKLQNEWKKIGTVPRKHSDRIWKQFRAACDHFFNAKSEFFKNIDSVESDNMNLKLELIEKIKNYDYTDNKESNLNAIKEFQRNWLEIGRVPINDKNRLQADFRKAIDDQLDRLKINQIEVENIHMKNRLDQMGDKREAEQTIGREIFALQNKVTKIKADINLWENNIGFLANSKNAEILKSEIDKKISKAKQEIDQMNTKIKYLEKLRREN